MPVLYSKPTFLYQFEAMLLEENPGRLTFFRMPDRTGVGMVTQAVDTEVIPIEEALIMYKYYYLRYTFPEFSDPATAYTRCLELFNNALNAEDLYERVGAFVNKISNIGRSSTYRNN